MEFEFSGLLFEPNNSSFLNKKSIKRILGFLFLYLIGILRNDLLEIMKRIFFPFKKKMN